MRRYGSTNDGEGTGIPRVAERVRKLGSCAARSGIDAASPIIRSGGEGRG